MRKIFFIILILSFNLSFGQIIGNQLNIGDVTYKWIDPFAKSAEWKAIESYANANSYALPTNVGAYDQLIKDMKAVGIWQKLDVFYVFVGDGSVGFKLINWINPNQHYADAYGGLTWDLDGVKGNGSNGYIDTNYNSNLESVKFDRYDASILICSTEHGVGTKKFLTSTPSSGQVIIGEVITNASRLNDGNNTSPINYDVDGLKILARNNDEKHGYSKVENNYLNVPATGKGTNDNQTILRHVNTYSQRRVQFFGMGAFISYEEYTSLREVLNKFLVALGLTPVA